MAKKATYKVFNGTAFEDIYFKTSIEQVEGLQDALSNIPQATTLSVGTTTTSASGGNASVTQRGTAQARIFDFVIPRGEQGEKGTASLNSIDVRGDDTPGSQWDLIPANMDNRSITSYFSQFPSSDGMGTSWKGLLNIKGWSGATYASWQLIGPASTSGTDEGLFYRTGNSTSGWSTPRRIYHSGNLSNLRTDLGTVTTSVTGLMSVADKYKLNGIAAGAQVNVGTNLSQGARNTTTLRIDSSTGSNLTLPAVTTSLAGLMTSTDKTRLNVLHSLLEEDTENNVVDSINEVLAVFNNYPEGADLVTALAGKVDKVSGKGLSTNDYTTADKNKLDGIATNATANNGTVTNVSAGTTQVNGLTLSVTNGTTTPTITTSISNAVNFRTAIGAGTSNLTTGQVVLATTENKNILGTTESVFNVSEKKVWFNKGALFYGTALDAGLVTRGISGTNSTGSTKDHLYINYDGNNTLSRQLVLGAGSVGTSRGNGIYDYSAVRGDALIAYLNGTLGSYLKESDISAWAKKPSLAIGDIPTGTTGSTVALGNHTHSQYLTSFTETDTLATVTSRGNTTTNHLTIGALTSNGTILMPFRGTAGTDRIYQEFKGVSANDTTNENSGAFIRFGTSTSAGYGADIGAYRRASGQSALIIKTGGQNPTESVRIDENKNLIVQGTITSSGQSVVLNNDPSLTNARTPLAHTHTIANVTGLQAALNAKGTSNLTIGTTASTAKAGNYHPTYAQVTSKPTNIIRQVSFSGGNMVIEVI